MSIRSHPAPGAIERNTFCELLSLPNETLVGVIAYLSQKCMPKLSLTCCRLYHVTKPLLFRHPQVLPLALPEFARNIKASNYLAAKVRGVSLIAHRTGILAPRPTLRCEDFGYIQELPNLETLEIEANRNWGAGLDIMSMLQTTFARHPGCYFANLQKCTVRYYESGDSADLRKAGLVPAGIEQPIIHLF